jgi:hypothetical protein
MRKRWRRPGPSAGRCRSRRCGGVHAGHGMVRPAGSYTETQGMFPVCDPRRCCCWTATGLHVPGHPRDPSLRVAGFAPASPPLVLVHQRAVVSAHVVAASYRGLKKARRARAMFPQYRGRCAPPTAVLKSGAVAGPLVESALRKGASLPGPWPSLLSFCRVIVEKSTFAKDGITPCVLRPATSPSLVRGDRVAFRGNDAVIGGFDLAFRTKRVEAHPGTVMAVPGAGAVDPTPLGGPPSCGASWR